MTDLIRFGVYVQTEGTLLKSRYQFRFYGNQIPDIPELIGKLTGTVPNITEAGRVSITSKDLFKRLKKKDFTEFGTYTWNVPRAANLSLKEETEYLRAIIDTLGDVGVEQNRPAIRLTSVNTNSLIEIMDRYNGSVSVRLGRAFAYWKDDRALQLLKHLDFKFYNPRNQRGSELVKAIKWKEFI